MRSQISSAVIHIRSGLDMLPSSDQRIQSSSVASRSIIHNDIFPVLIRQGCQANYFADRTNHINQLKLVNQLRTLSMHQAYVISGVMGGGYANVVDYRSR